LEYFTVILYILWPFCNVAVIWYIFPRFGILCQEKSGNPVGIGTRKSSLLSADGILSFPESRMVARFFLEYDTKTGKNVPNEYKMYRTVIKYPRYS
jgi:hypothetical protein